MARIGDWSAKSLMSGYAAVMVALGAAFYVFPDRHVLIWCAIGILSAGAVLVGVQRHQPRRRTPWLWVAAGIVTFNVGDTVYNILAKVGSDPNPFPSFADLFYIVTYVMLAGGILGLSRAGAASVDRTVALDAVIFSAGVALLWWLFLIGPKLTDSSHSFAERLISV